MSAAMFVLVGADCGHLVGCSRDRSILQFYKNRLIIHGHKVRIEERDFTEAEAMGLIDGERCARCTIDGNTREVIR